MIQLLDKVARDKRACGVLVYERLPGALRSYTLARSATQAISWVGTVFAVRKLDRRALGLSGIALVAWK